MGALLRLVRDVRHVSDLPAALGADPWAAATQPQRRVAEMRQVIVAPLAALVDAGASITHAAQLFHSQVGGGVLPPATVHALAVLASSADQGGAPSLATLKRWVSAYRRDGKAGLLPQHTGRVRRAYGWEQRAVALYNTPGKPGYADVAFKLRAEGLASASESRVKRYLKALPATLGENSPARVGRHLHRLTRQKFQRRSVEDLLVGEIYAGDGHTMDSYVAHPNTGGLYRPELTLFIDIKSRYIAGWFFSESETKESTLFALSAAMLQHDHVPAWLYIDRGAGYRAQLLSDLATGWYAKFDIDIIGALPGNPHGKGWVERFFRTVRDKFDKFFAGGEYYCGDDMAPEVNRRLSDEVKRGSRTLRTLHEYVAAFKAFIDAYHMQPMDCLGGRTPAQVWAELTPVAVGLGAEAVMRPRLQPTVARQTVRFHNRFYYHEALALYDGKKVVAEYDWLHDGKCWVYDLKGRFVCEARLVNTIGVLPTSRLDEGRDRRERGQVKRLERHLDEVRARRQDPITAETQARAIELLDQAAPAALPAPPAPPPDDDGPAPVIDITDWTDHRRPDA